MHHLVLLYGDPADDPVPGTPEFDADMAGYAAFDEIAGDAIVLGEALDPTAARTVRHDGDDPTVTDGPFAEVVEGLGGFYVLDAPDLDAALELARRIPAAAYPHGAIEVRPLVMLVEGSADPGPDPDGSTRHLATLHGREDEGEQPGTSGWDEGAEAHGAFAERAGAVLTGGGAVHPTSTATTIRVRDGELLVSDGPFAEAVEVVGGFYLLRGSPDEVLAVAAMIPVGTDGAVTLHPAVSFD